MYSRCGHAFLVSPNPIPSEAHPHSRWITSPFTVRHILVRGDDVYSRWVTLPIPVRMFIPMWFTCTTNAYVHREWGCAGPTRNGDFSHMEIPHPHQEWRCASPGMHISLGMHIVYAGWNRSAKLKNTNVIQLWPNQLMFNEVAVISRMNPYEFQWPCWFLTPKSSMFIQNSFVVDKRCSSTSYTK